MRSVERSTERRELVREAGLSSVSTVSVLAGVLVAYGAVLLLLALAAGVGSALGFETTGLSDAEWRDIGVGAAVALGVVLFVSYFFGGYVAGRMGRRSGVAHGLLVFVLGVVIVAVVAAVTSATADGGAVTDELRNQGIPTAADDWRDIGLFGGIGVVAAMLIGSLLGGWRGERWHGVLVTRALDPEVLPRGVHRDDDDHRDDDRRSDDRRDDVDLRDRRDDTAVVPATGRDDDRTTEGPTVVRDERVAATDPDATTTSPAVGSSSSTTGGATDATVVRDERPPVRAGDTVDLTEAERTAAARQEVEAERQAQQRGRSDASPGR